jgi:hypothetical protein
MILAHCALTLIFSIIAQSGGILTPAAEGLTADERERLAREQKLDNRIKIYETASKRLLKSLETAVIKEQYDSDLPILKAWTYLLNTSFEDIEKNASRKKKSKALIRLEIQLRKALSDVQEYKLRAPLDQQGAFDAFLSRSEQIRKKFVEILFPS